MTLEEAIEQIVKLGEKDPLEIARKVIRRYDEKWLAAELVGHGEEIVAEIARQRLGHNRRSSVAALPAVLTGKKPKREIMLASIFIPGVGHKALGDCTAADHAAREQFYLNISDSALRWAAYHGEWKAAILAQGVERTSQVKGPLPELQEAVLQGAIEAA